MEDMLGVDQGFSDPLL
jgi:hypothetical protein